MATDLGEHREVPLPIQRRPDQESRQLQRDVPAFIAFNRLSQTQELKTILTFILLPSL